MSRGRAVATLPAPSFAAHPAPSEAGPVILWDNANIVESFPERTLPLTFSVAVELYAAVYRGACRTLGVPRATIEREARTFEQMLGLLQGCVYYNLSSWYRVLSLLPGFRLTSGFLEAMMGARRPGSDPEERTALTLATPAGARELATMTARLGYRMLRFDADAIAFRARIAALLEEHRRPTATATPAVTTAPTTATAATAATAPATAATAAATAPAARAPIGPALRPGPGGSPEALLDEFDRLRDRGLRDWRAPILNDLFLMLAHGALRRVADRWLGPEAPGLVTGLLAGGRVASARPGAELLAIAAEIRDRPAWSRLVLGVPPRDLWARLEMDPELADLASRIRGYLDAWGDRAPRELQLDRPSYRDDPAALLGALRSLVAGPATGAGRAGVRSASDARRRVRRRLLAHPAGPVRVAMFDVLLRGTRRHIRWREEMRLARGELFGIGRLIFRDLGIVLHARGLLDDPADVHYLTIGELRGLVAGTAVPGDPRDLVRARRASYERYAALPRLPSRLETWGPVTDPLRIVEAPAARPAGTPVVADPGEWQGIGAAVGRVRAACLPVLDPTRAEPEPGRIIVARSTDPGWVPLLVGAAGLAVEQGGLLSHSAIVARELGVPTVVGLPGLLDRVRDGDVLELDGWTGVVRLVPAVAAAS